MADCLAVSNEKQVACISRERKLFSEIWSSVEFSRDPTSKFNLLHARRIPALEW